MPTILEQNPLGKVPVLELDDGTAVFDSPVILEYLDHLAGGGKIIPKDGKARFEALRLQALADGILDASILVVYEGRYRPAEKHEQKWLDLQNGKVARGLAALEASPPGLDSPPTVGQITVACAARLSRLPVSREHGATSIRGWRNGSMILRRGCRRSTPPSRRRHRAAQQMKSPGPRGPGL